MYVCAKEREREGGQTCSCSLVFVYTYDLFVDTEIELLTSKILVANEIGT